MDLGVGIGERLEFSFTGTDGHPIEIITYDLVPVRPYFEV